MISTDLIKKIRRIEIRTRRLVNDSYAGEYHSVFKGRGMEFDEVRPYQIGDEIRSIDWNVTARTGQPYVKRYVEERELTVMLVVDASASENFGSVNRFKRELAAELTAVLSFAATTNNDKVGLLIFTDQIELFIPPRKGRRHVLRLIRELLAFEPQNRGTDIRMALEKVNQILKRRSIIFLVSDFLAEPENYRQAMAITNRRHDLIAVDLNDPLEKNIKDVGLMALEDPETGQIAWVDTSSRAWQKAYQGRLERLETGKTQAFRQASVDRIDISTDEDYTAPLTTFFRDRAKRIRH
ncbi:MAG: hypothetical protein AMJ56_02800 [Anaerolineae bacterium SG8_19]|jgi:uncharacterized protein (DUF58 family)|nr:MAG: hypothetical protein AMJ56_02800 [Anaerolineae bacterium SG8_19]HCB50130.1 DUF58 domain-containing protein [Chloroflexota bacterium]